MNKTKTLFLSVLINLLAVTGAFSQIAIDSIGSQPDSSAMLDIKGNTKGLLIPRMTKSQRNAIVSPATSLLIFQTDSIPGFYYYNGAAWVLQSSGNTSYLKKITDTAYGTHTFDTLKTQKAE
ncbi:MAG: hypothetical protein HGB12_17390, partial [Bacteroidetes bacterium]|nr:hypothetical protein [Bacteroidota bacterium]